jgi:hypothetical protein
MGYQQKNFAIEDKRATYTQIDRPQFITLQDRKNSP